MALRKNILIKHNAEPNSLRTWLRAATPKEREKLATLASTTIGSLNQFAGAYRTGGLLNVDADMARRIELATVKLQREGLPVVARESLSPACAKCEFAKTCRG